MPQSTSRITRKQAAASLQLYEPPGRPGTVCAQTLARPAATHLLKVFRRISHNHPVEGDSARRLAEALCGSPAIGGQKRPGLQEALDDHGAYAIGAAFIDAIIDRPGAASRGAINQAERRLHDMEVDR